jgi:hypothetical protein
MSLLFLQLEIAGVDSVNLGRCADAFMAHSVIAWSQAIAEPVGA